MPGWTRWLIGGVVLLVVAAGAGVAYLVLSETTTPVEVDDAVDRYRDEHDTAGRTSTTLAPRSSLPDEGVYVYVTDGQDEVDVLDGSIHVYPAETTLTITHTECGLTQRWSPLDERWDEEEVCVTASGWERHALRTHHEFFGMSDDQEFACEPGYLLLPAGAEAGASWRTVCEADGTTLTGRGELVAFETLRVEGQDVETVHVRIAEEASGSSTGPSRDDYWWRVDDGLLIERVSSVDTRSDSPVGTATYREEFRLRLTSLSPRT